MISVPSSPMRRTSLRRAGFASSRYGHAVRQDRRSGCEIDITGLVRLAKILGRGDSTDPAPGGVMMAGKNQREACRVLQRHLSRRAKSPGAVNSLLRQSPDRLNKPASSSDRKSLPGTATASFCLVHVPSIQGITGPQARSTLSVHPAPGSPDDRSRPTSFSMSYGTRRIHADPSSRRA